VQHVVPQALHMEALEDGEATIEFRVRQPIEASVRAQITSGDQVLVSRRLRYARPSEMVTLSLDLAHAQRAGRAEMLRVEVIPSVA
jgi:hypothetical protein